MTKSIHAKSISLTIVALLFACGCAENTHESGQSGSESTISCGSSELHQASHDICTPMDAKAVGSPENGSCLCVLGYAWNGTECAMLADCSCEGADCDKLTMDKSECEAAHASCTEPVTTTQRLACSDDKRFSLSHDACAPMDAKAAGDPENGSCSCLLGYAWNGTECAMLADCFCEGADCDKLTLDKSACEAAHASCTEPVTTTQRLACSDTKRFSLSHDACAPMDAKAVGSPENGSCLCALGYAWNGTECSMLADCFCEGADCDKLTLDKSVCEAAHASCS